MLLGLTSAQIKYFQQIENCSILVCMEPTQETEPGSSELPAPLMPFTPSETAAPLQVEAAYAEVVPAANSMTVPAAQASVPVVATPMQDASLQGAAATAAQPATVSDDASLMADDADLIEKEWVVRAKAIVEQTKENPFEQNKAMHKVKAEYIKKRYNKDLKVSEG
jgi:hypothetical protein